MTAACQRPALAGQPGREREAMSRMEGADTPPTAHPWGTLHHSSLRCMAPTPLTVRCTSSEIYVTRSDGVWYAWHVDASGSLVFSRKASAPPTLAVERTVDASAIYGSFQLLRGYYIAVVTQSSRVSDGPDGSSVFRAEELEWLPLTTRPLGHLGPLSPTEKAHEELYLSLLRRISSTRSFYWAVGYDLTSTLQAGDAVASGAARDQPSAARGAPEGTLLGARGRAGGSAAPAPWATADPRFWWNGGASASMVAAAVAEGGGGGGLGLAGGGASAFISLFINGFVGSAQVRQPEFARGGCEAPQLLLITRRAWARQGTRFHMRGAAPEGACANLAETEQLLLWRGADDGCGRGGCGAAAAFTQLRGSIPLLWSQAPSLKYTPRAELSGSGASSLAACAAHLEACRASYGRLACVNLIDKKGDQRVLGQAYAEAVAKLYGGDEGVAPPCGAPAPPPAVHLTWFDFHHECRKMRWGNLSKLLDALAPSCEAQGWYARGEAGATGVAGGAPGGAPCVVLATQRGALRVNCMDNLDRTNVVQSLFARRAALRSVPGAWQATQASGCSVLTSPFPAWERAFNTLWADNADAVSELYSGTGALKTDFTRTGKRTAMGALADGANSLQRYLLNNLQVRTCVGACGWGRPLVGVALRVACGRAERCADAARSIREGGPRAACIAHSPAIRATRDSRSHLPPSPVQDGRTQDAWDLFTGVYSPRRGSSACAAAAAAHAAGVSVVRPGGASVPVCAPECGRGGALPLSGGAQSGPPATMRDAPRAALSLAAATPPPHTARPRLPLWWQCAPSLSQARAPTPPCPLSSGIGSVDASGRLFQRRPVLCLRPPPPPLGRAWGGRRCGGQRAAAAATHRQQHAHRPHRCAPGARCGCLPRHRQGHPRWAPLGVAAIFCAGCRCRPHQQQQRRRRRRRRRRQQQWRRQRRWQRGRGRGAQLQWRRAARRRQPRPAAASSARACPHPQRGRRGGRGRGAARGRPVT